MVALLVTLLILHGAIHGLGVVKAFDLAPVPALRRPISRGLGALWLLDALAFVLAAAAVLLWPGSWWLLAAPAVVLSLFLIASAWSDAKFGLIPNLVLVVPLVIAVAEQGPSSMSSSFWRQVVTRVVAEAPPPLVTPAELEGLPPPLRRYLERAGVVGRPHVRNFRAVFGGQLRNGDSDWMTIRAEQYSVLNPPARMFLLHARRYGVPFEALHLYVDGAATMEVQVASLISVVDARGPEMDQSETVTFFNDLCLLAPAALLDAQVDWKELDAHRVEGRFRLGEHVVRAVLTFSEEGELLNFVSEDRFQSSDGKAYRNLSWSTPMAAPRDFGVATVASKGDAVWSEPEGLMPYAHFELRSLEYNLPAAAPEPSQVDPSLAWAWKRGKGLGE